MESNNIPEEIQKAIEKAKQAQKQLKKKQQEYCINKYHERKESNSK